MKKNINLNELADSYIASGLSISGLAEYLSISEDYLKKWEQFFNLSPNAVQGNENIHSKENIQKFIKIKEHFDKGRSLREIREKLHNNYLEVVTNPFEKTKKQPKNIPDFRPKKEKTTSPAYETNIVRPFLTQLNKANLKIEKLLHEKTRVIENTAIEKAKLVSKIEILKAKNADLTNEKDYLSMLIKEKEHELKRHFSQESALGESLVITQEILRKKEFEIDKLKEKIDDYEKELEEKNSLIHKQSLEINEMLEKQDKKWWQFWKFL